LHDASSGEYADQSGPGSELDAVDHASTVGTIRRFERFEAAFRKEDDAHEIYFIEIRAITRSIYERCYRTSE
jgi:hypothetical protein